MQNSKICKQRHFQFSAVTILLTVFNLSFLPYADAYIPVVSEIENVADGIGKVVNKALGIDKANKDIGRNVDNAHQKAMEILSMLDMISQKGVAEADTIAKERLEQVRSIFQELDSNIGKNIDRTKTAIDSAVNALEKLRNNTVRDIDRIFEQIYGVLNEAECVMMGQVMSVEMVGNNLLTEVGKNLI